MAKAVPEATLLAKLLELHNQDRWNGQFRMPDGPVRRALRRKGWIETYQPSWMVGQKARRWRISLAGRERLVNVPGSGITRGALPPRPHAAG